MLIILAIVFLPITAYLIAIAVLVPVVAILGAINSFLDLTMGAETKDKERLGVK